MRKIFLVIPMLIACGQERLRPVVTCGQPCYTGPAGTNGRGTCSPGTWVCDGQGGSECLGVVLPGEEVCDGQDNDCDGNTDEFLHMNCGNACGPGDATCTAGQWVGCTAPMPHKEVCNGRDDDCDGLIDNNLAIEFCYTGDPSELTQPAAPCAPGIFSCQSGRKVCIKEVKPVFETCNHVDDDCDGLIDEGSDGGAVDVVFVIDNSGSMSLRMTAIKKAVAAFASTYCDTGSQVRCAVVAAPDNDLARGSLPILQTDFADPTAVAAKMDQQGSLGSGDENTVGAIDMLISATNPLKLSWKGGAKKMIIVFSDEEAQNYAPCTETYGSIAAKVANVPGSALAETYAFIDFSFILSPLTWNAAVGSTNVFNIDGSQMELERDLSKIIKASTCTP